MMSSGDGFSSPPPLIHGASITNPNPSCSNSAKRKRNLPGNPDPDAEIIALSPRSLMATNRFVCEICSKGFQRDQNLQLHRRGHNLPWKLKQRNKQEVVRKKVYICPEISCVHHDPSRALGDLTGVKKHFSRKHGEKKWKCEKCTKKYAVKSDWKAHSKICGTKEYRCDCGTLFSRKDSFITHRAFCDPLLTEENSRMASFAMVQTAATNLNFKNELVMMNNGGGGVMNHLPAGMSRPGMLPVWLNQNIDSNSNNTQFENSTTSCSSFFPNNNYIINANGGGGMLSSEMVQWLSRTNETVQNFTALKEEELEVNNNGQIPLLYSDYGAAPPPTAAGHMSATALLQKASQIGSTTSSGFEYANTGEFSSLHEQSENLMSGGGMTMRMVMAEDKSGGVDDSGEGNLTRDFLGVEGSERREFSNLQQELMKFSCWMNDSSVGFGGGNDQ